MNSASTILKLKMLSDPANLAENRRAIETFCADNGFDKRACDEIGLSVNEALANVIRHAYDGAADKPIEMSVEMSDDTIRISIRDWGNGVNPCELPAKPPDPLRPGGLGMVCLKQMMSSISFRPQSDGMLLEMTRKK